MSHGPYDTLPTTFPRRRTRPVRVGNVTIGGDHPVVVQSMITEETKNVAACVRQIVEMHRKGAEIVRVTTPSMMEAHKLGEIKEKLRARLVDVPLVADVHHQGGDIAVAVAQFVDKVRINPGLFVFHKHTGRSEFSEAEHEEQREAIEESLLPVIEVCKRRDIALRIGVNHGSLAERMLVTHGDTPEGMVESALEYLRICEKHGYRNLVISLKASRVPIMLAANRLMVRRMEAEGMDYPLHLGVTEAGDGQYARVKSTAGIATLLAEGIGDTIRVSLSEDPVNELPVCYEILQALGLRKTQVEFIACPSCGRTKFDLPTVLNQVKAATSHLVGLDIAVMGCFPPGETVVTADGFVPIETVQPGQDVLTREGDLRPVTAVDTHSFEGELVEIRFRGAPPMRVTPNHPILALPPGATEPLWFASEEIGPEHTLLYPVLREADGARIGEDLIAEMADKVGGDLSLATSSPRLAYGFHQGLLRQGIPAALSRTSEGYEVSRDDTLVVDGSYLHLPVLSVTRVPYAGPVHNFEVAGSGTYVASLAVVHNCIVNGPGEMADADYGYVGKAGGRITLYRKREEIKTVDQSVGVEELVALIKADGKWQEPGAG